MASELKHKDQGTSLTKAEYENIDAHVFNNGAIGDIAYGSSATQISRLGIGTTGDVLQTVGGIPAWTARAFIREGGQTTEATTTSTVVVTLLTATGLSIPAATPFFFSVNARKSAGGAFDVNVGLKLNATQIAEANYWVTSAVNRAESGGYWAYVGPRVTNYDAFIVGLRTAMGAGAVTAAILTSHLPVAVPIATITDVIIVGYSGNASVTLGADELQVYKLGVA